MGAINWAMLDKDDWKRVTTTVIGGLIIAGIVAVIPVLRDLVWTPVPIRPIWIGMGLGLLFGGAYYRYRRAERLSTNPKTNQLQQSKPAHKPEGALIIQPSRKGPEPEWKSYTSDTILGVDWIWRWNGTSIEGLTPNCPECGLELTHHEWFSEDMEPGEDLRLDELTCDDPTCGFTLDLSDMPTIDTKNQLNTYVMKHIRREASRMGYDPSTTAL